MFPYLLYATAIFQPIGQSYTERRLASLKYLFSGTTGLFFQIFSPNKFRPILFPIKPLYGR